MKHSQTGKESGASDVSFITEVEGHFLLPFNLTPNDILERHRSARRGEENNDPTPAMKGGNYFQDGALAWFNDDYGTEIVEPKKGYKNKYCNMVASLDGLFQKEWMYNGIHIPAGSPWECKIPRFPSDQTDSMERILQVQSQIDCVDAEVGVIAELSRSDFVWRIAVVYRHENTIKAIRKAVDTFWEHMEKGTEYLPMTNEEANRLLQSNYFDALDLTEGPTDQIGAEARQLLMESVQGYDDCRRAEKSAKEGKEINSLNIKRIMGGVEKIKIPGYRVNFTTRTRKATVEKITPAKPESKSVFGTTGLSVNLSLLHI